MARPAHRTVRAAGDASSSAAIQYAQSIFDGSKGYHHEDSSIRLFRPQAHIARLSRSAGELCMPAVDSDLVLQATRKFIALERDWVPSKRGTAIYVRQTMVGNEGYTVVRPSNGPSRSIEGATLVHCVERRSRTTMSKVWVSMTFANDED
jgi:branched-subunit amino acid aminotransferase/4-amino-4-deoxychorismate lyase